MAEKVDSLSLFPFPRQSRHTARHLSPSLPSLPTPFALSLCLLCPTLLLLKSKSNPKKVFFLGKEEATVKKTLINNDWLQKILHKHLPSLFFLAFICWLFYFLLFFRMMDLRGTSFSHFKLIPFSFFYILSSSPSLFWHSPNTQKKGGLHGSTCHFAHSVQSRSARFLRWASSQTTGPATDLDQSTHTSDPGLRPLPWTQTTVW